MKIKKIIIKKTGPNAKEKEIEEAGLIFWRVDTEFEEEREEEKKRRNGRITGMSGPSCKGCQDLSNIFLKVAVSGWTASHA